MFFDIFGMSPKKVILLSKKIRSDHLTLNLLKMYLKKLIYRFTVFIIVSVAVSCNGSGKKSEKETVMQQASLLEVSIGGMSCSGCEQTIQNNVGKLEGIKSVKASFTAGNAIIEYYPSIADTVKIKEAVTGSGYTFKKFGPFKPEENIK